LLFGAGALAAAVGPPLVGLAQRTIPARRLAAAGAALAAAGLTATCMKQPRPMRRRLVALLGLVLATFVVLRLFGVQVLPTRWLVVGWIFDIVLGLAELVVVLAAARAFRDGVREGGVLRGYERWIDKEEELGMPRPLAHAARVELRLYQAIGRAARRQR